MNAERSPTKRGYVTAPLIAEIRIGREVVETINLNDVAFDIIHRLALEGAIRLVLSGAPVTGIIDGTAIPERKPPGAVVEPTNIVKAIAAVRCAEIIRIRGAKSRVEKDASAIEALAWAKALSDTEVDALRKLASVKAELGRLTGETIRGTLEEVLQSRAATAEPVVEDESEERGAAD